MQIFLYGQLQPIEGLEGKKITCPYFKVEKWLPMRMVIMHYCTQYEDIPCLRTIPSWRLLTEDLPASLDQFETSNKTIFLGNYYYFLI